MARQCVRSTQVLLASAIEPFRSAVLEEFHVSHPGIVRMKELSRSHIWWPHLDKDLETLSKNCDACQEERNVPASAPLHPWSWPTKLWTRIQLSFAGSVPWQEVHDNGRYTLQVAQSFGDLSTTVEKMVEMLRLVFSTHDLPEQVTSDNEASFNSDELRRFMKSNGTKHL